LSYPARDPHAMTRTEGHPMDAEPRLTDLLPGLPAGDDRVARAVFDRYSDRLVRLADQHLSRKLAGRVDGEDVVQSVFRTFFRRGGEGQFRIDSSAQLWQLLVRITILKARAKGRFHTAGIRDAGAERAADSGGFDPAAAEPGPEDAAELVDQIDVLLRDLPPLYGKLLGLRLQGHAVTEVADELAVSRQTVHRALNLLQDRLTAMAHS
jgi:DNA-directed RNA polymerase specialized sigma24 family protein